ncbi:MAG: capsular biosynthesis protein, partial [Candidatus Competibacteraceae bacterium]|nr:capsular biosynthesis protein [Candidatus Competibacteraceae bacterium]
PNPSELLMKSNTKDLIIELKKHYDFILIDSPPVALVTDAFILSELAEHTIYITRQNHTPKEALTNINEYYVSHKITHISIVFNDIANNRIGYGYGAGYGYGYGYGYGSDYGSGYYDEDKPAKTKGMFNRNS